MPIVIIVINGYPKELIDKVQEFLGESDYCELSDWLDENYKGKFKDVGDYAHELLNDTGALENIPDYIKYHIDFESIGRDMVVDGDIFTILADDMNVYVLGMT
jgi:antirestriction protein